MAAPSIDLSWRVLTVFSAVSRPGANLRSTRPMMRSCAAAADAAGLARDAVRVRTGDLQRSITSERVEWAFAVVEAGGPSAPHVRPVEKHTGFFNRSVDTIEQELRDRVAGAIIERAY